MDPRHFWLVDPDQDPKDEANDEVMSDSAMKKEMKNVGVDHNPPKKVAKRIQQKEQKGREVGRYGKKEQKQEAEAMEDDEFQERLDDAVHSEYVITRDADEEIEGRLKDHRDKKRGHGDKENVEVPQPEGGGEKSSAFCGVFNPCSSVVVLLLALGCRPGQASFQ